MPNPEESKKDSSIYQRHKTYIFISIEYILIVALLVTGPVLASNPILVFLKIVGL